MTVCTLSAKQGELIEVSREHRNGGEVQLALTTTYGRINSDLTIGAKVTATLELRANAGLTSRGVMLFGEGFLITRHKAADLGFGLEPRLEEHIRPYLNGRDVTDRPRGLMVIDLFGLRADEVRDRFPKLYQHVLTSVKPERDSNRDKNIRENWWVFGRPRSEIRPALAGIRRFIAIVETSKHRIFQFLDSRILADNKLIIIALEDAFFLGVLSSRLHVRYALAAGSWLGVGNDPVYAKSRCFDPFPFPACTDAQKTRIRTIAEELDAHRKRVQAQHPELTLTGMYNVLEKLRSHTQPPADVIPSPGGEGQGEGGTSPGIASPSRRGEGGISPREGATPPPPALTAKERRIHDLGLVSVLRQLHDDLDAAVFDAYGWSATLTDAEILERLVALNAERAKEEASGLIRWLRPEYQNPGGATQEQQPTQQTLPVPEPVEVKHASAKARNGKLPWPKSLPDRVKAVAQILTATKEPLTSEAVAAQFKNARKQAVQEILETLCTIGKAHKGNREGTYVG